MNHLLILIIDFSRTIKFQSSKNSSNKRVAAEEIIELDDSFATEEKKPCLISNVITNKPTAKSNKLNTLSIGVIQNRSKLTNIVKTKTTEVETPLSAPVAVTASALPSTVTSAGNSLSLLGAYSDSDNSNDSS